MRWMARKLCEQPAISRWLHWLGRHSWRAATGDDLSAVYRNLDMAYRCNEQRCEMENRVRAHANDTNNRNLRRILREHDERMLNIAYVRNAQVPTAEVSDRRRNHE